MESKKRNTKKNSSAKTKRTTRKSSGTKRSRTRKTRSKVKVDSTKVLISLIVILIGCIILLSCKYVVPKFKEMFSNQTQVEQTDEDKLNQDLERLSKEAEKEKQSQNKKSAEEKKKAETAEKEKKELERKLLEAQKEKETLEKKLEEERKQKEAELKAAEDKRKKEEQSKAQQDKKKQEQTQTQTQTAASFNFPQAVNKAQIVFLLDDGGQNLSQLEKFTSLQMPLTIAVLPKLAHSKDGAQKVRSSGKELMLHQPMQSVNSSVNPGPGAVKPEMSDSEIRALLAENFDEVGPIAGFNNHEGSAITADAHKMEVIMKYASDNGVFFLDSRTNKDTQVPYVCQALGYSYYERNGLFLDNKLTQAEKDQGLTMRTKAIDLIRKNVDKANKEGVVIMIGHVWSADWLPQVLKDVYPELKAKGYTVTTVSKCKGKK